MKGEGNDHGTRDQLWTKSIKGAYRAT